MKTRTLVAAALALGLVSMPAQAGIFGGKDKKKVPAPQTSHERMGQAEVYPSRPKPSNKAGEASRRGEHIRRHQSQPVFVSHPWVRGL